MSLVIKLYVLLVLTLAVHLAEEIRTGFRIKFPFGEIPKRVFVGVNIVIYSYAVLTLVLAMQNESVSIPLIWVFAIIQILNVIGHIGFMLRAKGYFPGGYTTIPLLLIALLLTYGLVNI
ncbi:MAG: HXXEE domain-containing protein [Clostridia bacterium]|nr:HXXEE domain-containing protein [Clostridia bacterium]